MHEREKIREAAYFLEQMEAVRENPLHFQYNLSAFLSAARSVAQYALKEARARNAQAWYDGFLASHPVMKLFASERDANIHDRPVQLGGHVDVYAYDTAVSTETIEVESFDEEGNVVDVVARREPTPAPSEPSTFRFIPHYRLDAWSGDEEAVPLAHRYLGELREFLAQGQERGHLPRDPEHAV